MSKKLGFQPVSGNLCGAVDAGRYECPRCEEKINIQRGQNFPRCTAYDTTVTWKKIPAARD